MAADRGRARIRLATADADRIIAAGNDRTAVLGHYPQIAILQVEVNLLARARLQMNPLESPESDLRCTLHSRELEIDLYSLISRYLAGIGYGDIGGDRLSRSDCLRGHTQVAVLEGGVAQS